MFATWIDTFVLEKNYDTDLLLRVEGKLGLNLIPLEYVIKVMKAASPEEKEAIKQEFIRIDLVGGDCLGFFNHLAKAIVD